MTSAAHRSAVELELLLQNAIARLSAAGVESARLDAELLLAHAAGVTRETLLAKSVAYGDALSQRYATLINLRLSRKPLAYILGHREFYSLEFQVSPEVLIPRPESETVVAASLEALSMRFARTVLDLGTGSGAIGLAIAANSPHVRVMATDISAPSLEVAKSNASLLGVAARVDFRLADCFSVLDGGGPLGRYDQIVANPPYIRDGEINSLAPEVRDFEPRLALAGGSDGLNFYRRIAAEAELHLLPGGSVIVEVGQGQAADAATIFRSRAFNDIAIVNDLAGIQRVVVARNL